MRGSTSPPRTTSSKPTSHRHARPSNLQVQVPDLDLATVFGGSPGRETRRVVRSSHRDRMTGVSHKYHSVRPHTESTAFVVSSPGMTDRHRKLEKNRDDREAMSKSMRSLFSGGGSVGMQASVMSTAAARREMRTAPSPSRAKGSEHMVLKFATIQNRFNDAFRERAQKEGNPELVIEERPVLRGTRPQYMDTFNGAIQGNITTRLHKDNFRGDFSLENVTRVAKSIANNHTHQSMYFASARLGDEGAAALLRGVAQNVDCGVHTLDLSKTGLGPRAAEGLRDVIKQNRSLKVINIEGNKHLDASCAKVFAPSLEDNITLHELYMANCPFKDEGIQHICRHIAKNHTSKLRVLGLEGTGISGSGVQFVSDMIKANESLREIRLNKNALGYRGAKVLCEGLSTNQHLLSVHVCATMAGLQGAREYGEMLGKNKYLKEIQLQRNDIAGKGAEALAKALETNETLEVLALSHNRIGDDGVIALVKVLSSKNRTLKKLDVHDNGVGPEGTEGLTDISVVNDATTHTAVSSNFIEINDRKALFSSPRKPKIEIGDEMRTDDYKEVPRRTELGMSHERQLASILSRMSEEEYDEMQSPGKARSERQESALTESMGGSRGSKRPGSTKYKGLTIRSIIEARVGEELYPPSGYHTPPKDKDGASGVADDLSTEVAGSHEEAPPRTVGFYEPDQRNSIASELSLPAHPPIKGIPALHSQSHMHPDKITLLEHRRTIEKSRAQDVYFSRFPSMVQPSTARQVDEVTLENEDSMFPGAELRVRTHRDNLKSIEKGFTDMFYSPGLKPEDSVVMSPRTQQDRQNTAPVVIPKSPRVDCIEPRRARHLQVQQFYGWDWAPKTPASPPSQRSPRSPRMNANRVYDIQPPRTAAPE